MTCCGISKMKIIVKKCTEIFSTKVKGVKRIRYSYNFNFKSMTLIFQNLILVNEINLKKFASLVYSQE